MNPTDWINRRIAAAHRGWHKAPGVGYGNAIDAFRFFCVLAVVPLHCVFLDRYPDAIRVSAETVERWFGALAWSGLKLLFLLSGFLFFRDVRSTASFGAFWKGKLRRRMRSLLVPYLFWNLFAIAWRATLHRLPDGDVFDWLVGCGGWAMHPVGGGLWFVKTLLCFALLAPLHHAAFRLLGRAAVPVGIALVALPPVPVDWPLFQPWLFLGGALAFRGNDLRDLAGGQARLLVPAGVATAVWAAVRAAGVPCPAFLGVLPFLFLFAVFDALSRVRLPDSLVALARASTFLYFAHFAVSAFVREALLRLFSPATLAAALSLYLLRILLTVALTLSAFLLLRRFAPRLLSFATGGRS